MLNSNRYLLLVYVVGAAKLYPISRPLPLGLSFFEKNRSCTVLVQSTGHVCREAPGNEIIINNIKHK